MPKYVIERTVPGVGALSAVQLQELSSTANIVLGSFETGIQWVHSYVAEEE